MVAQRRNLQLDKGKGKAPGRSQQAVDKLDYLVTFNRSITQAMAHTMQDLTEGVFVNMANLTLARRDSYLEYLRTGVKQDNVTALRTAPLHNTLTGPRPVVGESRRGREVFLWQLSQETRSLSPLCFN